MEDQPKNPIQPRIDYIRRNITAPAIFEMLAEECSELSQAALKRARILRGENPTNADEIETVKNFKEEVSDVILVMNVLGVSTDDEMMLLKANRWVGRIQAAIERFNETPDIQPEQQPVPEIVEDGINEEESYDEQ